MANTTDKSILTAAGKALLAQLNAEEKPLIIDKMIFANVPNRPEFPQPDDVVPTDHVVHQEGVEQRGRLSADSVIYSTTLTSDVGPFEFNWTGAYCSEYGVLVTIDHHALTPKSADEPGVAGNTLVRSVVLEYKDIAEITNITVDASSWQYNATPRMKKMDDDVAQAIIDQNGKDWFIEDGFLVTPQASAFNIKAGAGYVSGNRVMLEFDRNVQVPNKPSFIYVDAHREGTPTGEQVTLFDFVVTAEEKDDYTDVNGVKHFVCKIAQVLADGSVSDLRPARGDRSYADIKTNDAVEQTVNLSIYPKNTTKYAKVGELIPSGTQALRLESSGMVYVLDGQLEVESVLESVDFVKGTVTLTGEVYQAIPVTTENSIRVYRFGNDADSAQAAIKSAYRRREIQFLIFEQAEYELDKAIFFNSYPEDGLLERSFTVIANGTTFKLVQPTSGGAVLNFGRGADEGNGDSVERAGYITWFGGVVNGNSIEGENGWAFERAENCDFHNIRSINCKRDYVGSREGGRGLTVHARCKNVNIFGYTSKNCSDDFHVSHKNDYSPEDAGNVAVTGISKATQAVVTAKGHKFSVGMQAAIYNCAGMTQINPTYDNDAFYEVVAVNGDSFTIDLDTSEYDDYTSDGRAVIADITNEGRTPAVSVFGGLAEDCEYSGINIEGANHPRNTRAVQTVNVLGRQYINCATTPGRGLINGSTAVRLNADVTSYNEKGKSINSIVRGSFQKSNIKVFADVTDIESYIDARPTEENPAGSGIDAGYPSHPYGTSADNNYEIVVAYRSKVQSGVVSYIRVDESLSGSIKQYYRNHADITVTGLPDGVGAGSKFNNVPLHNTNTVRVKDNNLGRVKETSLARVEKFDEQANTHEHGGYEHIFQQQISVKDLGADYSRYAFKDISGVVQASIEYKPSNGRLYYRIDGNMSAYQMSSVALFPSTPSNKDCGTAGLPFRNFFAQNSAIQASDKRLKNVVQLNDEFKTKFWRAFEKGICNVDWFWQWKDRAPDDARTHCTPLAQDFFKCFEDEGIDPFEFAFACYDSWDDVYEETPVYDNEGQLVSFDKRLIRPAGDQYSIRMNEIMALFIQYQVWLMNA